jgi:aarF domain-containing kinase
MAAAWGRTVEGVFTRLTPEPVAAASLGQVYRGVLAPELGGMEVAVKVQRPGVLDAVALDLYLMRSAALALQNLPEVRGNLVC